MDSVTQLLVQDRIERLQREAAERRAFGTQESSTFRRLADAMTALVAAITSRAPTSAPSITPALDGYPYRG